MCYRDALVLQSLVFFHIHAVFHFGNIGWSSNNSFLDCLSLWTLHVSCYYVVQIAAKACL